ncbi:MAG TPA: helix-turn-helix transcriptional regulator [Gaiella sp.]|nr:helix-turn-helix transcriptional regulator [Gaiella sp.]
MRARPAAETAVGETQGSHLARLIQQAGLNNNKLATLAGVRRETISRVVNDHAGLGATLAKRLAPPLGVTIEELVVSREAEVEPRRSLELRLRELEEDRDYLLQVVRELLAHLEKMGVGAPHIPSPPRSSVSVRAPGRTAQDGSESLEVAPGQRRPQMRRHR